MATRSVILRETQAGPFGVYHHGDSYPTGLGKHLWKTLHGHFKGDVEQMLKWLIDEHPGGWSTIVGTDPKIKAGYANAPKNTFTADKKLTKAYERYQKKPKCYCHGTRSEKGGIATLRDARGYGAEWAYVFDIEKRTLAIYDVSRVGVEVPVKIVDLDGDEPAWERLECGDNFGRCSHYAWHHFPEMKGTRIGTRTYLGFDPLTFTDAVAVEIEGKRYVMNGSGHSSSIDYIASPTKRNRWPESNLWIATLKAANGKTIERPVAIVGNGYRPYPGVTWIFPPTLNIPYETKRAA